MVPDDRIELPTSPCKSEVMPFYESGNVWSKRRELNSLKSGLQSDASAGLPHLHNWCRVAVLPRILRLTRPLHRLQCLLGVGVPSRNRAYNFKRRRLACYPLHYRDKVGTLGRNRTYISSFVAKYSIHYTTRALKLVGPENYDISTTRLKAGYSASELRSRCWCT